MKDIIKVIIILSFLTVMASCSLFKEDEREIKAMEDLSIPSDFDFETERWINVELSALYDGTFYLRDMEGNMLYKGFIDQVEGFKQKIKLPTAISEVEIEYHEVESVTKRYRIRDNEIVHSFVPQIR